MKSPEKRKSIPQVEPQVAEQKPQPSLNVKIPSKGDAIKQKMKARMEAI